VLKIHSLQQGQYGLVIDQVTMVISKQAQTIPYPLHVWIANNVSLYNNNLYRVTYRGQATNAVLAALYMTQPLSYVSLLPGETDELSLEVRSIVVADLHFQVQVTYHVIGQLPTYTLLLPTVFEIIFSDPANWHPYSLQNGHMVPTA
jgi:ABC-type enterochelin transport system permease subunit